MLELTFRSGIFVSYCISQPQPNRIGAWFPHFIILMETIFWVPLSFECYSTRVHVVEEQRLVVVVLLFISLFIFIVRVSIDIPIYSLLDCRLNGYRDTSLTLTLTLTFMHTLVPKPETS